MRRIVETSAVITALDEALVKVARFRRTFAPLEPFKELRWVAIQEAMELSKISRGIHKILEAEPVFSGNLMMNFGSDSVSITAFIGQKLLEVAETRGSEPALEWLDKVLNTSAASCLCVAVVRGVKVEGSIDFGQGIVLMPFDNLPPSNNKRALTGMERRSILRGMERRSKRRQNRLCYATLQSIRSLALLGKNSLTR